MGLHFDLTDEEFIRQFKNGSLDPALFTHEAHLRLAWINLRIYPYLGAIQEVSNQIQHFVKIHNAQSKYNHTLTIAAVKTVYHFLNKSKSDSFGEFISEFPRLKHHFKELLQAHYSIDIVNLEEARHTFIEPDLLPYD